MSVSEFVSSYCLSLERFAHWRVLFCDFWRRRHLTSARKHHPSTITKVSP